MIANRYFRIKIGNIHAYPEQSLVNKIEGVNIKFKLGKLT